jgi:aspartate/methionine/tyrosine aminotransferase
LQVEGAKEIAVEFFSLSKSYNMPGWRVGFMVGNPTLVEATIHLVYLDTYLRFLAHNFGRPLMLQWQRLE